MATQAMNPSTRGLPPAARISVSEPSSRIGSLVEKAARVHDRGVAYWNAEGTENATPSTEKAETFESGQVGESFGVLIQGAVMLAVGVFVTISVFDAVPDGGTEAGPLYQAQETIESMTGQAFEIAPIVLIVIIAFVIMQYVRRM